MKNILLLIALAVCSNIVAQVQHDSFTPIPGQKYIVSAWVKDDTSTQVANYSGKIRIINDWNDGNAGQDIIDLSPSGNIIDGWQQITGEFTVHPDTERLEFQLVSVSGGTSNFDDIRVYPFNGNMKSFVYDPVTQQLMAELDENNYATLYEYDNEGGLVRVKKETERGTYTVQETRSGNAKINN